MKLPGLDKLILSNKSVYITSSFKEIAKIPLCFNKKNLITSQFIFIIFCGGIINSNWIWIVLQWRENGQKWGQQFRPISRAPLIEMDMQQNRIKLNVKWRRGSRRAKVPFYLPSPPLITFIKISIPIND